jgi:hypothetical protein
MKKWAKLIGGSTGMLCAVWGFFFHFHFFPYDSTAYKWWYIPGVFTAMSVTVVLLIVSLALIEEGRDNR